MPGTPRSDHPDAPSVVGRTPAWGHRCASEIDRRANIRCIEYAAGVSPQPTVTQKGNLLLTSSFRDHDLNQMALDSQIGLAGICPELTQVRLRIVA